MKYFKAEIVEFRDGRRIENCRFCLMSGFPFIAVEAKNNDAPSPNSPGKLDLYPVSDVIAILGARGEMATRPPVRMY